MRALQVIHDFLPEVRAGSELCTYYLSSELKKRGHEVLLFYPTWGSKETCRKQVGGVDCFTFPNFSNPMGIFSDFNPEVNNIFSKVLIEFKPDVVHIQNLIYLSLDIVKIAKASGAKVIFTLHDFWLLCPRTILLPYDNKICSYINHIKCVECCKRIVPLHTQNIFLSKTRGKWTDKFNQNVRAYFYLKNKRAGFIKQNIFKNVDLFISPSRFLRNKFIEAGLDEEKIIFLDNGTEKEIFNNLYRQQPNEIRFGFIGSILPHKGIETLIEAFNGINDAELRIYGKIYHANLAFQKLVSNPKIKFMGEISDDEKKAAFEGIDVLIVPSLWFENSPVSIHEAYTAGVPVVASNIGGMVEYVKNMETGLLFDVGNPRDLFNKLRYLIDKPSEIERMRKNLPDFLSIAQHAAMMENVYNSVLKHDSQIRNFLPQKYFGDTSSSTTLENKLIFYLATTLKTLRDAIRGMKGINSIPVRQEVYFRGVRESESASSMKESIMFGEQYQLIAFEKISNENSELTLSLKWKLKKTVSDIHKVFIHVCDGEKMVFGKDRLFFDGILPLSNWLVEQTIEERITLPVPLTLKNVRQYKIKIGIYNSENGNRLILDKLANYNVDDNSTRVEVGEVDVNKRFRKEENNSVSVSVVIPTKNGGKEFGETLRMISEQKYSQNFEIVVVDSGSTDETLQNCLKYGVKIIQIDPASFNHGTTRNLGVYNAKGEFVILTVQDAIPTDDMWLENLVKNFRDEKVAGVYGRQIPREDADIFIKRQLEDWLTARSHPDIKYIEEKAAYEMLNPMEKYMFCNFDDVCSCIRKSVWEKFPFPRTEFAEDLYFSKRVLEAGYKIVYEPAAAVVHSHNKSTIAEYKRTYIGHRKLNELFGIQTVPSFKYVVRFFNLNVINDTKYLIKKERNIFKILKTLFKIPFWSFAGVYAQYAGARDQIRVTNKATQ